MILKDLYDKKKINCPKWLTSNVHYLTIMGSTAYGVNTDNSDWDIYGFCIPPKHVVFPHTDGYIQGFGKPPEVFNQWQQAHIIDDEKNREYDFQVYGIVTFFNLCLEGNPNITDALFTPERCVLHCTNIARKVKDNRKLFLHQGMWHQFRGYAHSQMHKIDNKNPEGKRKELVDKFGYDVKFAYHLVRLLDELEQILTEHDLNLERSREILKAIRRGEWTLEQLKSWFFEKEKQLEQYYNKDTNSLAFNKRENEIKDLLVECLEDHFGDLSKTDCVQVGYDKDKILNDFQSIIDKYK